MPAQLLVNPHQSDRFGDVLLSQLGDTKWKEFRAAFAFVKRSGVRHIASALTQFSRRGDVKITVGVDFGGTSAEGLSDLFEISGGEGHIWVYHNSNGSTFHPKVILFRNESEAFAAIGSSNLTGGGLFTNYELSLATHLDLAVPTDKGLLDNIELVLDGWLDTSRDVCRLLTSELLDELTDAGYLPPEVYSSDSDEGGLTNPDDSGPLLFGFEDVPSPPSVTPGTATSTVARTQTPQVFYMTLQRTDVGRGQVTPGTSARSPEVFIPLAARDAHPDFWEWQHAFVEDSATPGKWDRTSVQMLIGTQVESVNMMTWPVKHDFRLRCEALRSAGNVGDILRMERTPFAIGYQYVVNVVPIGTSQYAAALAHCSNPVRNSTRRWGYA